MSRIVWIFTVAAFALWTLLSLGAWAAVSVGGDVLHGQLDWLFAGDPTVVPAMSGVVRLLQGFGAGAIALIWLLGALLLWAGGLFTARLVRGLESGFASAPRGSGAQHSDEPPAMKDITPPRAAPVQRRPER